MWNSSSILRSLVAAVWEVSPGWPEGRTSYTTRSLTLKRVHANIKCLITTIFGTNKIYPKIDYLAYSLAQMME